MALAIFVKTLLGVMVCLPAPPADTVVGFSEHRGRLVLLYLENCLFLLHCAKQQAKLEASL
jgi:hypothetical protein